MIEDKELLEDAIKHFKSLQKRYTREHNGKMCTKVAVALEAMEKQVPKKPLRGRCGTLCPSCHRLEYIVRRDALDTHCGFCGQAIIDWSDDNGI